MASEKKSDTGKESEKSENKSGKMSETSDESTYSIMELSDAARILFHTTPDCVTAALRRAGHDKFTKNDAQKLVMEFVKTPVSGV